MAVSLALQAGSELHTARLCHIKGRHIEATGNFLLAIFHTYASILHIKTLRPTPMIYLIRHGRTDWNDLGMLQGQDDTAQLTDLGKQQARVAGAILARDLAGKKIQIWSSTSKRAQDTAHIIATNLDCPTEIACDAALREADHGCLSGQTKEQYSKSPYYQTHKRLTDYRKKFMSSMAPDGESLSQVSKRALPALRAIMTQASGKVDAVIVVTHGGVIKAIRAVLTQIFERYEPRNCDGLIVRDFLGATPQLTPFSSGAESGRSDE
jgi:broad specificity phosphatase PhoE